MVDGPGVGSGYSLLGMGKAPAQIWVEEIPASFGEPITHAGV